MNLVRLLTTAGRGEPFCVDVKKEGITIDEIFDRLVEIHRNVRLISQTELMPSAKSGITAWLDRVVELERDLDKRGVQGLESFQPEVKNRFDKFFNFLTAAQDAIVAIGINSYPFFGKHLPQKYDDVMHKVGQTLVALRESVTKR